VKIQNLRQPEAIIYRNFSLSEYFDEKSFFGRLRDCAEWDDGEYWLFEWALYELAPIRKDIIEIDWPVFRIFSYAFLFIGAHFDPNDSFKILNLDGLDISDRRERLQLVVEGYFLGVMPNQAECFSMVNPLIADMG